MFLERIAVFTLQVRAKLLAFFHTVARETNSQLGQLFYTCILLILTGLLYYTWAIPAALWIKVGYSVIYLLSFLICVSGIYFLIRRKRIRNNSEAMEVFTLEDGDLKTFQHLNLKAIKLSEDQAKAIFEAFHGKYLYGNFKSFQSLIKIKTLSAKDRLEWIDPSPKNPNQVNRQTLLEFLSQLLIGFENLENHQMLVFADHYFILRNSAGNVQKVSSKNISDWRTNKAAYLKEISRMFKDILQ